MMHDTRCKMYDRVITMFYNGPYSPSIMDHNGKTLIRFSQKLIDGFPCEDKQLPLVGGDWNVGGWDQVFGCSHEYGMSSAQTDWA